MRVLCFLLENYIVWLIGRGILVVKQLYHQSLNNEAVSSNLAHGRCVCLQSVVIGILVLRLPPPIKIDCHKIINDTSSSVKHHSIKELYRDDKLSGIFFTYEKYYPSSNLFKNFNRMRIMNMVLKNSVQNWYMHISALK